MYFEETDLCYTIHQLGYRIINIPQSQIVHLEGKSFKLKKQEKNYTIKAEDYSSKNTLVIHIIIFATSFIF